MDDGPGLEALLLRVIDIVIFSLFDRKPDRKRKEGRPTQTSGAAGEPTRTQTHPASLLDAREQARRTVAKIDEIESEMMGEHESKEAAGVAAGEVFVPSSRVAPAQPAPLAPAAAELAGAAGSGADGVGPDALPSHLEEATVLYANRQTAAAAAVLMHAARGPGGGAAWRDTWLTLFDLYQATGNLDEFEALAIGFSTRFESSPPAWDPDLAPPRERAQDSAAVPALVPLPAALTAQALEALERAERYAAKQRAVILDASAVTLVDAVGAARWVRVLEAFEARSCALYVPGAERLLELSRAQILLGQREANDGLWRICLAFLRVLDRPQEFDDLAIDYCVTYEVSPPAWEGTWAHVRAAAPQRPAEDAPAPAEVVYALRPDACVLRGNIDGRAHPLWAELRAYAQDRAEIVLDCRALRRIDFVAAGELLNEIVALRAGGKYCVLKDVSHLVAGLLVVMGITGLADVRVRRS